MAIRELKERYDNAIIDTDDMTITEITDDGLATYSLVDILNRWNGMEGVTLYLICHDSPNALDAGGA